MHDPHGRRQLIREAIQRQYEDSLGERTHAGVAYHTMGHAEVARALGELTLPANAWQQTTLSDGETIRPLFTVNLGHVLHPHREVYVECDDLPILTGSRMVEELPYPKELVRQWQEDVLMKDAEYRAHGFTALRIAYVGQPRCEILRIIQIFAERARAGLGPGVWGCQICAKNQLPYAPIDDTDPPPDNRASETLSLRDSSSDGPTRSGSDVDDDNATQNKATGEDALQTLVTSMKSVEDTVEAVWNEALHPLERHGTTASWVMIISTVAVLLAFAWAFFAGTLRPT